MSDWDDGDATALANYMARNPKFIKELASRVPKIVTTNSDETAISGAKHAGAEEMITAIEEMKSGQGTVRQTPFFDASKD